MNAGELVSAWLEAHGPTLALGATVVLAVGTLAMRLHRAPTHRRRLGLLAALATAVNLLLAAVPLPRAFPAAAPRPVDAVELAPLPAAVRADAIERTLMQLDASRPAERAPATLVRAVPGDAASPPAWPWQRLLVLAYVGGVVLFLLRLLAGAIRLRLLLASCTDVAPATLHVPLPQRTRLLAAPRDVRPFCAGTLRPVIVLPRALLAPERRAEAIAVIRHEAAHVRNGDPFAQAVLALLAIPLFWHPLLWWLVRDVRFHGELLADDAAAGAARAAYARALLDLAERAQPELRAAGTVAVFHRPSEFFRRIQMLLQREGSLSTSISLRRTASQSFAALALVVASSGLFGVNATAQESAATREAELRNTIEALRADLAILRAQLESMQAERSPVSDPLTAPVPAFPVSPYGSAPTKKEVAVDDYYSYLRRRGAVATEPAPQAVGSDGQVRVGDELFQYSLRKTPPPGSTPQPPVPGAYQDEMPALPGEPNLPVASSPFFSPTNPAPAGGGADSRTTTATADLASRYVDLLGELELAEATVEDSKRLHTAGLMPPTDARRAEINVRTLKRKLAMVDKLLTGEIAATEADIAWLAAEQERVAPHERGRVQAQLQRATMRLDAMRSVR